MGGELGHSRENILTRDSSAYAIRMELDARKNKALTPPSGNFHTESSHPPPPILERDLAVSAALLGVGLDSGNVYKGCVCVCGGLLKTYGVTMVPSTLTWK